MNSEQNKRIIKGFLIVGSLFLAFLIGNYAFRMGIIIGPEANNYKYVIDMINDFPEFNTLLEVREDIELLYDGEIDDKALVENATKAMTETLGDPYTIYMNEEEFTKYMQSNSGSYMGIGVYLTSFEDNIVISGLVEGGTAEEVGFKPGDIIVSVDGEPIENDIDKAVSLISGSKEKLLKINIERENVGNMDFQVQRRKIKTIAVTGDMVSDEIGYIRLRNFNKNCSKEFSSKVDELSNKGMKALILDLRDNGGGYLDEAVNIVSEFVDKGKTVTYTIDKYNKKIVHEATGSKALNIPVVILTNENSASASEVLTGALMDYKVAETVGVTTFGKGIVQEIFPLTTGNGGFKVTVSKYYTPHGENIHESGIDPNYEVVLKEGVTPKDFTTDMDNQFQKALEVIKEKIK